MSLDPETRKRVLATRSRREAAEAAFNSCPVWRPRKREALRRARTDARLAHSATVDHAGRSIPPWDRRTFDDLISVAYGERFWPGGFQP